MDVVKVHLKDDDERVRNDGDLVKEKVERVAKMLEIISSRRRARLGETNHIEIRVARTKTSSKDLKCG